MSVTVNDRTYAMPARTAIVICLDGCEPAYLDEASKAGKTPVLDRIRKSGADALAHSVIPSFTNPNNMSIATTGHDRQQGHLFFLRTLGRYHAG